MALTLLTLATYALFPAAPPWMAGLNGYLPEVARVVSTTLEATGVGTIRSAVQRGEAYANAVAAIPSLHSGVPMMVLLFSWPLVGVRTRALLVAYVLAMTFTLAYGGEHYVVDAVVGLGVRGGRGLRCRPAAPAHAGLDHRPWVTGHQLVERVDPPVPRGPRARQDLRGAGLVLDDEDPGGRHRPVPAGAPTGTSR